MPETALAGLLKAGVAGRRGAREVGANHVRQGLATAMAEDEQGVLLRIDEMVVRLGEQLEHMTAFVAPKVPETGVHRVYISQATWDTLNYSPPAVDQFIEDMMIGGTGMKFIVADRGPVRHAILAEAKAKGTDVILGKDTITDLTEKANSLVVQAASLNRTPSEVQQQAFAVRYATLMQDYTALQERMAGLGDLLGLAAAALYDTTV